MGNNHRTLGKLDGLKRRALGAVRHVDDHADAVHLADHLAPEAGNAAVFGFVTAAGEQALVVVGELHDQQAQVAHYRDHVDIVLDGRAVLGAEEDANPPLLPGAENIRWLAHRHDQITVFFKAAVPLAQP